MATYRSAGLRGKGTHYSGNNNNTYDDRDNNVIITIFAYV